MKNTGLIWAGCLVVTWVGCRSNGCHGGRSAASQSCSCCLITFKSGAWPAELVQLYRRFSTRSVLCFLGRNQPANPTGDGRLVAEALIQHTCRKPHAPLAQIPLQASSTRPPAPTTFPERTKPAQAHFFQKHACLMPPSPSSSHFKSNCCHSDGSSARPRTRYTS